MAKAKKDDEDVKQETNAADAPKPTDPKAPLFTFISKYPGLQLHLRELKTPDGDVTIRSLEMVEFKPQPVLMENEDGDMVAKKPADILHHEQKGKFFTTDPILAERLRKHRRFGKEFREITKK